jgi:hypothetical protein
MLSGPRSSSSPSLTVPALHSAPVSTVSDSSQLEVSSALICAASPGAISSALSQHTNVESCLRSTHFAEHFLHVLHDSSSPRAALLPHVAPYKVQPLLAYTWT